MQHFDRKLLTLPQAAKISRDISIMRMEIGAIHSRLAQMPTRSDLARAALDIIFCTAVVTALFGWWLMPR
jgi:hypothetical protein